MNKFDHLTQKLVNETVANPRTSGPSIDAIRDRLQQRKRRRRLAWIPCCVGVLGCFSYFIWKPGPVAQPTPSTPMSNNHIAAVTRPAVEPPPNEMPHDHVSVPNDAIPFLVKESTQAPQDSRAQSNAFNVATNQPSPQLLLPSREDLDLSSFPESRRLSDRARVMAKLVHAVPVLKASNRNENAYEFLGWARDVEIVPIELDALPAQTQSQIHQVLDSELSPNFWSL